MSGSCMYYSCPENHCGQCFGEPCARGQHMADPRTEDDFSDDIDDGETVAGEEGAE